MVNKALLLFLLACSGAAIPAGADSLYDQSRFRSFVSDHRAYRSGDKLTVLITEIASVSTTANTTTGKDGTVSATLRTRNENTDVGAGLGEDFSGGGKIERTGKLVAQLTVTIQSVDANGDLVVKGEQEIEVNDERQWLALEGRVRPEDVKADNTVYSSRISDAKIKYTGNGLLAEKQKPGILTRFLSWLRIL
jgi:flagellar L-ring protein FlgH